MTIRSSLLVIAAIAVLSSSALATTPWGITVGTATYDGSQQLTFSGVTADIQYSVGSYKWTKVNSTWYGANAAASPGASYALHREFDAMGLFFRADESAAHFLVFTGMPEAGVTASSIGYGNRVLGPGDLKIDTGGNTYGVGLRLDNLLWAINENETNPAYKIYNAATGAVMDIHSQDAGTRGEVELNPTWGHVDNYNLAAGSDYGYAFYVDGSGAQTGTNTVAFADTGVSLSGYHVYSYDVSVPWSAIGSDYSEFEMTASWRPDCGNDLITGSFSGSGGTPNEPPVPEASTMMLAISGLGAVAGLRKRTSRRTA